MNVHFVDGTYELFRHFFALPSRTDPGGREVGALIGVAESMLTMLGDGVTHLAVATDHVIESFRNDLWPGYKTGEGIDPALLGQFHPLEDALEAMGVTVFRMTELEADDGLAAGARAAAADPDVERVFICTPDKDLSQSVVGERVVQFDRRKREIRTEQGVIEKFGVPPASIPDWLALVGDSADGFPGIPGWGAKSAATVLARYRHLDAIPDTERSWDVSVRGASRLAANLAANREAALLFRDLATLRTEPRPFGDLEELRWQGPREDFHEVARALGARELAERAVQVAGGRRNR